MLMQFKGIGRRHRGILSEGPSRLTIQLVSNYRNILINWRIDLSSSWTQSVPFARFLQLIDRRASGVINSSVASLFCGKVWRIADKSQLTAEIYPWKLGSSSWRREIRHSFSSTDFSTFDWCIERFDSRHLRHRDDRNGTWSKCYYMKFI